MVGSLRRVGIFGTSGMAREAADIAWALGYRPLYVAADPLEYERWPFEDDIVLEADVERYADMPFVIGIGSGGIRRRIYQSYAAKLRFINLLHPDASFGHRQRESIERQCGVLVCAGARLTNTIRVGDFSVFNTNVTVHHDCVVEDFCTLAPQACVLGNVHLESNVWVGAGAIIHQGTEQQKLRVGQNTLIGAGAVVLKSCVPDAVYAGVPARKLR